MEENLQTPASRLIDALKQKKLRVAAAEAVNQITNRLKGVKADAERHDQPQRRGCGGRHRTSQQAYKI